MQKSLDKNIIRSAPIPVDLNAGKKKAKNGIANMKIDIDEYCISINLINKIVS